MKARLAAWAQVTIGLSALVVVVIKSDARGLADALHATRISLLPLAVIATVATTWLMAYRWGLILRSRGHRLSTNRLFGYYLVSTFFSNFVPGGTVTADVTRLLCAARDINDRPLVLSTLVYERMIGMFTLLTLGLGASLMSSALRIDGKIFYLGEAFLILAFVGAAMLLSIRVSNRLGNVSLWLGEKLGLKSLGEAGSRTLEAIAQMRRYRGMALSTLLVSVALRIVWSMGAFAVSRAMDLPISLPMMFALVSIIDLIRMLPISIGGLGVREWATVVLFGNLGIPREQALMFAILAFAPLVLTALAGGLLYVTWAGVSVRVPADDSIIAPAQGSGSEQMRAAARR